MNLLSRLQFIMLCATGFVFPAGADVSGFEHLLEISIECGKTPVEAVRPHVLKRHFVCTYENRLCKVLNKKELQFEAYISVDCEVKAANDSCPPIEACAKPNQLSTSVAEEVRRQNDPNFNGSATDGAALGPDPNEKNRTR